MSFQITAAPSTRVTKSRGLRRTTSSPLATPRRPSGGSKKPKAAAAAAAADDDGELFSSQLEDHGLVRALATDQRLRDVPQQMQYAGERMFDGIPPAGGFDSTRIAELLNFRRRLPPIVTVAHVHALSRSPTATDREIAELVRAGVLRRITIPGRGLGRMAVGASLVLADRWAQYVRDVAHLDEAVKLKYIRALGERPGCASVPASHFTVQEVAALVQAGLLTASATSSAADAGSALGFDRGSSGSLASLSTAGSRAAAGSLGAVGGAGAFYDAGGGGGGGSSLQRPLLPDHGPHMNFTLPSVGVYLRLLEAARNHIVALLSRSAFREAPRDLLQERYEGAVASTEKQRRAQGVQGLVLPARTKKWKQLYGLRFQWVLEECLGTGLVEVFETGSVGQGVRLT